MAHQESTQGQVKGVQALHTPSSSSATRPLNRCHNTPHQIFPGWDTGFRAQAACASLFDGQSNRAILFHFTQSSVSEIRFSPRAQRPSFGPHHLAHYQVLSPAPAPCSHTYDQLNAKVLNTADLLVHPGQLLALRLFQSLTHPLQFMKIWFDFDQ